jgi:hypothetical protein
MTLRAAVLVAVFVVIACGKGVRIDVPIGQAARLVVRDADGRTIKTVSDPATLARFDRAVDRIAGWFDDVFPRKHRPAYTVDLLRGDDVFGSLAIEERHLRYTPGKGAVAISKRQHEALIYTLLEPSSATR